MAATKETWLPSYEELTVPELNVSSAVLRAGAHHLGKYCENPCREFIQCKSEEKDPRICLDEGKDVTRCALTFFGKLKRHCAKEFTQYWQCVDRCEMDMHLRGCRHTQKLYDLCVLKHLGQERPPVGYFQKITIHDSDRPMPSERSGPFPQPTDELPDNWRSLPPPSSVKYDDFIF